MSRDDVLWAIDEMDQVGWVESADLYLCYAAYAPPRLTAGHRAFSLALRRLGLRSQVRWMAGRPARCWFVTAGWMRRAQAHVAEQQAQMSPGHVG